VYSVLVALSLFLTCSADGLAGGTPLVLDPCSAVPDGTPCFADNGPTVDADLFPDHTELKWVSFPFDRVSWPAAFGFSVSNATHAVAVVGEGNGLTMLRTTATGGNPTVIAKFPSYCNALIPVGIVGDVVFAVTGDHDRCECASTSATSCQKEGVRIQGVDGTDVTIPISHAMKDAPISVVQPLFENAGMWAVNTAGLHTMCGNLTSNGTTLFNHTVFTDSALLTCQPHFQDELMVSLGILSEMVIFPHPIQTGYIGINGQSKVPRYSIGTYLIGNVTAALNAGEVQLQRGNSIRSPKPLFPGSAPLGLVSFSWSAAINSGSIAASTNTSLFKNAFWGALETTLGGTRPYLWIGSWNNLAITEVILLDLSNPLDPVRRATNFTTITELTSPQWYVRAGRHYVAAITNWPTNDVTHLTQRGWLRIFDVTDVQNVVETSQLRLISTSNYMSAMCGDTIFVHNEPASASRGNITWASISGGNVTGSGVFQVPDFDPQEGILGLRCDDSYLYVAIGQNGIAAYSYSSLPPTRQGTVPVLGDSQKKTAVDGAVYLFDAVGAPGNGVRFATVHVWNSAGTALQQVNVVPFYYNVTQITTSTITTSSTSTAATTTTATTGVATTTGVVTTATSGTLTTATVTTLSTAAVTTGTASAGGDYVLRFTFPAGANVSEQLIRDFIDRYGGTASQWSYERISSDPLVYEARVRTDGPVSAAQAAQLRSDIQGDAQFVALAGAVSLDVVDDNLAASLTCVSTVALIALMAVI